MIRPSLLSLLAALALAGCGNAPVISQQDPTNSADVGEIRTALSGNLTDVTVLNSPFPGVSDAQLAPIVAAQMPTGFLASGGFTADPAQATQRRYRIVWDFSASNNYGTDGGCGAPVLAPAPAPAAIAALPRVGGTITLCRDSGPFTRVYGYVDQASPGDANFHAYVTRMAHEILLYPMPIGGPGGGSDSRTP